MSTNTIILILYIVVIILMIFINHIQSEDYNKYNEAESDGFLMGYSPIVRLLILILWPVFLIGIIISTTSRLIYSVISVLCKK